MIDCCHFFDLRNQRNDYFDVEVTWLNISNAWTRITVYIQQLPCTFYCIIGVRVIWACRYVLCWVVSEHSILGHVTVPYLWFLLWQALTILYTYMAVLREKAWFHIHKCSCSYGLWGASIILRTQIPKFEVFWLTKYLQSVLKARELKSYGFFWTQRRFKVPDESRI